MRIRTGSSAWLIVAVLLLLAGVVAQYHASAAAPQATTPPLPTSVIKPPAGKGVANSASDVDVASFGYVEEEFLVSGKANIYQYDTGGAVVVKTPGVDYTTRILVRRPTDRKRFSGTVRVETMHPQYGFDFIWPRVSDYVFANGDAMVAISTRRGEASGIESMKRSDPVRYAGVNLTEEGLNWDAIGQIGRLLKTRTAANPLNGYDVKRLTAQGWSGGGALLLIYIGDGFHDRLRMPGGGPIFDGYLVGEPSGYPRINSSTPAIPTTDPRQRVKAVDVPVISLDTRPQEQYRRRADGDRPNDRYRVYEVAGASHNNRRLPPMYKQPADGLGKSACQFELSWFPLSHYFKSTLARLDAWVIKGVKPPASLRMTLKADGTPMVDAHGSPVGGVRSSYLDVPTARYFTNMAAPGAGTGGTSCVQDGAQERFGREKLAALYKDHGGYVSAVTRSVDQLARDRWLLPADAQELRAEAARFGGI